MKDSETQGEEQSLSPDDERLIKTGLKVFKNIATKWSMTLEQQSALLGCDDETLNRWMHGNVTPTEQELMKLVLTRISHVFGIYRSLHLLIENEELADSWLHKSNLEFDGQSATSLIVRDGLNGLERVHEYLQKLCEHLA